MEGLKGQEAATFSAGGEVTCLNCNSAMKAATTIAFKTHQDDDHPFTCKSPAAIKLKALEACLAAAGIQCLSPVSGIQISQEHPIWKNLI